MFRSCRYFVWSLLATTGCWTDPDHSLERASNVTAAAFYVDPVNGNDVASAGTQAAPWKSVNFAVGRIAALPVAQQAGTVLNLRSGSLYPPSIFPGALTGTAEQPIIVQPYDGATVTFDAGLPQLRQANSEWEEVPASSGGVLGEWRTKVSLPAQTNRYAWGQLMASKVRLVNYHQLGDLRAQNEAFAVVPLADPRPSPGPRLDLPTQKTPFVYMGPGVAFVFDDATEATGRIHIRLGHTHFSAPGITDYNGETNPNLVALSIARKDAIALTVGSRHVVFKNVVVQNGGDVTLRVDASANNVTFDHCQVYGARWGVRMSAATGIRFTDCLFEGGLAPWTTRSDVKEEYNYIGPADCPQNANGQCLNELGIKTHDILIIVEGATDSVFDRCTFRNGHDGISLIGRRLQIQRSLFEDLNDETWKLGTLVDDVRIHDNLVRQALNPISFATDPRVTAQGTVYIYRNIIDQRVPTRGFRTLPPDTEKPWVWRYGSDVKNGQIPVLHVYQNTFVASHVLDKGSQISSLFAGVPTAVRRSINNIYISLNLDAPLTALLPTGTLASTAGNVWYRFHNASKPLFDNSTTKYFSFAELHAARPDWEVGSIYQDPQLANFTDEYFDLASSQPNTDYRPVANIGGVPLPADLPDNPEYAGIVHAGALPASALPFAVGVDAATVKPGPGAPIARAGADRTIVEADGDGFEVVTLDGRASSDPEGHALTFQWYENGVPLVTGDAPTLPLAEGKHILRLVVTDEDRKIDSDSVTLNIVGLQPGDNRLANPGFESNDRTDWSLPSGASITTDKVDAHSGAHAVRLLQTGAAQEVKQRVSITPGTTYLVSGWLRTVALTPTFSTIKARVLSADGTVLETRAVFSTRGNSPYAYGGQSIAIAADSAATAIELVGSIEGAGSGRAYFDDLRVRDRNLLVNGGFEARSADGEGLDAPGWTSVRLGRVATSEPAHGGRRSLVMDSHPTIQQQVKQDLPHVPGRRYRVTAWVRTDGATTPAVLGIFRYDAAGTGLGSLTFASILSEGRYTLVERIINAADLPAATAMIQIEARFKEALPGTVRFDDFMVEPLP